MSAITFNYDWQMMLARVPSNPAPQERPAVSYTYDDDDRLTRIAQGTNSVDLEYDAASRVTKVSRSNGIVAEYGYDAASHLTSVVYKKGATVLGDLTYEYDAAGKRTKAVGSLARTGLPQVLTSATYNASDQLTQRARARLSKNVLMAKM